MKKNRLSLILIATVLFAACNKEAIQQPAISAADQSNSVAAGPFKTFLTSSGGTWTWAAGYDYNAITVLNPANHAEVWFNGAAVPRGQHDDTYRFAVNGTFAYNAKGATLSVQAGYTLTAPQANATTYTVTEAVGGAYPKINLGPVTGGGSPFIGTTDVDTDNSWEVISYGGNDMVLQGNNGGADIQIHLHRYTTPQTLTAIKTLLASAPWKLAGTSSIAIGVEGWPYLYSGGTTGINPDPLQADDVYTFNSTASKLSYSPGNGTLVAGGPDNGYTPFQDLTTDLAYTNVGVRVRAMPVISASNNYGAADSTWGWGIAEIYFTNPVPPPTWGANGVGTYKPYLGNYFIGVTDAGVASAYPTTGNTYRIISIDASKMVLRAGEGKGTVAEFTFVH